MTTRAAILKTSARGVGVMGDRERELEIALREALEIFVVYRVGDDSYSGIAERATLDGWRALLDGADGTCVWEDPASCPVHGRREVQ